MAREGRSPGLRRPKAVRPVAISRAYLPSIFQKLAEDEQGCEIIWRTPWLTWFRTLCASEVLIADAGEEFPFILMRPGSRDRDSLKRHGGKRRLSDAEQTSKTSQTCRRRLYQRQW